jgi:hypothetical protein
LMTGTGLRIARLVCATLAQELEPVAEWWHEPQ